MDGDGTSMATPQIAAACALWLQKHGSSLPENGLRVEACRTALFESADKRPYFREFVGNGLLNVPKLLGTAPRSAAELSRLAEAEADVISRSWRSMSAREAPDQRDKMLEVEFLQAVYRSANEEVVKIDRQAESGLQLAPEVASVLRNAILSDPDISNALREALGQM